MILIILFAILAGIFIIVASPSVCNLRYRSKRKIVRNRYTRMIEDTSQCHWGPRPDEPYLNIRYLLYDQPLTIKRQLSLKEFCRLKKERYADKRGWRLCSYAYLLNNICPECGQPLYATYQSSPPDTWAKPCGRAGILVYCPHCHADWNFFLYMLN